MCACGRPLHYTDPRKQAQVESLIASLGIDVPVWVGDRCWLVQRHYLALHGLQSEELPTLAVALGFPEAAKHSPLTY